MKKKFLSIFLTPLFVVPIALSSCSSNDMSIHKVFTYKADDYQLEIHPYIYESPIIKSSSYCDACNISVIFNHPDTATKNQQIYIDSLTINDSYTNPDNGFKYKTCFVTFANDKNKVLADDGFDANVEYVIGHFSVSASVFSPSLSLNSANKVDTYSEMQGSDYTYSYHSYAPIYSKYTTQYLPKFSLRNPSFDVQVISPLVFVYNRFHYKYLPDTTDGDGSYGKYEIDGTPTFSDRLVAIDGFNFGLTSGTAITLPSSLKIISEDAFKYQTFYQNVFTIPQSVEKIENKAFYTLKLKDTSSDSSSTTVNKIIKVPSKFQNDEENIFGEIRSDIQYY